MFASASVEPAASAASVGRRPTEPVIPLSTTSAPDPGGVHHRLGTADHLDAAHSRRGEGPAHRVGCRRVGDRHERRTHRGRLHGKGGGIAATRGQRGDPE